MSKSLYITSTESRSGKSAIVLGVMQLLLRDVQKVAFFRPIISTPSRAKKDHDINLILSQFYLGMRYEDSFAFTIQEARDLVNKGQHAALLETVLNKYKELESRFDFVLLEGTDYLGGDPAFEFDINAEIAANLQSPALLVVNGHDKSGPEIVASAQLSMDTCEEKGVEILAAVVNRAEVDNPKTLMTELRSSLRVAKAPLLYVIPEIPSLGRPTVADVQRWLSAEVLYGENRLETTVSDYVVAAMQAGNFLDYITQDCLVVTPGDRTDVILSTFASCQSAAFPHPAGLILTGNLRPTKNVAKLIEGWTGGPLPVLLTKEHTFRTAQTLTELYGKIEPEDQKKIASALGAFESNVDVEELRGQLVAACPTKITPKMFEYSLIQMAKSDRKHIVLPEGLSERVLRAADILLRRGVADLTILGKVDEIGAKAAQLGLNLSGAQIIDPTTSPNFEDYANTYYELRKKKGMTLELARDVMSDITYFGTMMVYKGHADGMVSGSVTTTAQTIRPAFEFVKTKPGVSIVSSVFLMCLKDRVLVFGDCAVNPNPSAPELAEIATESAHTAKLFGISPRVAMLSYSTGESGKGEDVEKVIEATKLVKEDAPDLLVEGPLQYDAAIDPEVAQIKLPGSAVAGKATVFIFPDLNTGNNTYKAVQRAAGAVAIGPVLQGLRKPVNDLSRGCTVPDIVNTVAITAIQAQASGAPAPTRTDK